MVYRGKPSAGCENCRKAKKRCTLEQPACLRCVKLKKPCTGYRDTSQLQIQDESQAVILKANKSKPLQTPIQWEPAYQTTVAKPPSPVLNVFTPGTTRSDSSSSSSDGTIELPPHLRDSDDDAYDSNGSVSLYSPNFGSEPSPVNLTFTMKPSPDDIATNYFFNQFTSIGHWEFIRAYAKAPKIDPCLDLAIKACGMAAMDNIESAIMGKQYSRTMYSKALGLLNAALRDPERSRTNESLIAVAMLGYYENLTCDSRESIQSWKAHMNGATQLLRLRGKEQFQTEVGRLLFRETRAQILINSIWSDSYPPAFLWEWQDALGAATPENVISGPADALTSICYDFGVIRAQMHDRIITDAAAAEECFKIDSRMMQWSIDAVATSPFWRYSEVEVSDSEHVWNGMVHSYYGQPAPGVWNTWRGIRILVSRSQEQCCLRLPSSEAERDEQRNYFRKVRRQMTDDICATVPCMLGHAGPTVFNSTCVLISAYGSIWPLFFAGTCALERMGVSTWERLYGLPVQAPMQPTSAAAAQSAWLLGRLEHIADNVGLKWATGIAAVLKGDFRLHDDLLPDDVVTEGYLRRIEEHHRGVKYAPDLPLIKPSESKQQSQPMDQNSTPWLGRAVGEKSRAR